MRGHYVLENKLGQVVRAFNWDPDAPTDELTLVYLKDTRRIEAVSTTKDLEARDIPFEEILKTTRKSIENKPMAVAEVGRLRWVENIEKVSPSLEIPRDNPENFKTALKWAAGIEVLLLMLLFIVGHFVTVANAPEEPRLVTIVPRPEPEKPPVKQRVIEVTEHKIQTKNVAHHVTQHKVTKMARLRPKPIATMKKQVAINNNGSASILGSLEKSTHDGGLKVNDMRTSPGAGLGGTGGSGGVQTTIYGSGLMGAPLGPQAKATGAGGYGTHGKGGGEAGYGRISLIGSSNAYFQPVEQEATVEGGLDRDEIAAVIQRHLGQIRFCYEQGLQVKPHLNGRVAIRFFINGGGHVSTANISETSLHSSDVESCIVSRLKGWKFPEPRGGVIVKVTYPFVLKRVSQS